MSLTEPQLAELREKLLQEKNSLEKQLGEIAKPTGSKGDFETKFDNIGTDWEENATEVEEYTDNLAIEDNLEKQLKETIAALDRITAGNYGKCENCSGEIDFERLSAYPAARICVKCE